MKILFITPRFPYPPLKGDQAVVYHRLRLLGREHDITLVTFYQSDKELACSGKLEPFCKKIIPVKLSRYRSVLNMLQGAISSLPFQIWYFKSRSFENKIRDLLDRGNYDIIHTYMLRLAGYAEYSKKPKILDLIDSMQLNFERRARLEKYPLKIIFNMEVKRLRKYENDMVNKYDMSIVVSDRDRGRGYINPGKVVSIPLGVDTELFKPCGDLQKSRIIVFSGNMGYFPNENAIMWFYEKCFGMIKKEIPNVRLMIVGNNPGSKLKVINNGKSVIVTGYVDSIADELNKAQIAVAPMQAGSGMQFKILEAMACGLPVVATSLGLGAISATHNENVLIADDPTEFARSCVTLLNNHDFAQTMGSRARDLVNGKYGWGDNVRRVNEIYKTLAARAL